MRMLADTETQARLIREMRELYEKRGKLEARIRAADIARNLRIQKDALLDIAAYRALHVPPAFDSPRAYTGHEYSLK